MTTKKRTIGDMIKFYRLSRNLSQARLAEMIGKSTSTIGMYEIGKREPSMDTIEALADAFNIKIQDLIPDNDNHISENGFDVPDDSPMVHVPVTSEARILSASVDKMPQEERERLLKIVELMFAEYFEKGTDAHDP